MNIGFYNDSRIFGGHEVMTVMLANALIDSHEVTFYYHALAVGDSLNQRVKKVKIPYYSQETLASFNSLVRVNQTWKLARQFKTDSLDLLIVSQGMIELGIKGLIAAKFAQIRVASYLPLAFPLSATGGKFSTIRDALNRFLYRAFDCFFTISKSQEVLIRSHLGKRKPIHIVENVISAESLSLESNTSASDSRFIRIASIGRIEFRQKGQDKLIEIARKLKALEVKFQIRIIGDGPDLPRLKSLVGESQLQSHFEFCGWIRDKKEIYQGIDLILSTSNYEGVPLNMLESLGNSIPYLSPDQEIFREYLPDSNIYRDSVECADKIIRIYRHKEASRSATDRLRQNVMTRHSEKRFRTSVKAAIDTALM